MDEILQNISPEWLKIIYEGETKNMLDNIYEKIRGDAYTPKKSDWFNWCRETSFDSVKAVILGQDVYPTQGHAHGLSFSCLSGVPKSLQNIYKCLLQCGQISHIPEHGDLTAWARQGVLMLNVGLSTIISNAGAHIKIWEPYSAVIIKKICEYHYDNNRQLIFMLWGNYAKKFKNHIDCDFHIVLEWIHPSPLSQNIKNPKLKFIHCNHFTVVNEFLAADSEVPINWNVINGAAGLYVAASASIKMGKHTQAPAKPKAADVLNIGPTHHIAFTDGGAHPNNKSKASRAGWALCFTSGPLNNKLVYGNLDVSKHNASNIRAEGYAIIRVMELVNESKEPWSKLTIITDCMFWVDMIEKYMKKWDADMFSEKSNPDLTQKLWFVYNEISQRGEVKFIHVKSHNKDGWKDYDADTFERFCYEKNDYVDKMCNYARTKLNPADEVTSIFDNEL